MRDAVLFDAHRCELRQACLCECIRDFWIEAGLHDAHFEGTSV